MDKDIEESIRLDQTKRIFDIIAKLIINGESCSYRDLIYDLLGFEGYYYELINGLAITNLLCDYQELKKTNSVLSHELTKDTVLGQDTLLTVCGIPIGEIPDLQAKAQLAIHYKHLYSTLKKQKDEIVKYIKSFEYYIPEDDKNELLRMLGEIDNE